MTVDGIKISLGEVTKSASAIRQLNISLDSKLSEISKQMNDLGQTWNSDAYSKFREKFNALVPRFDDYKNEIENYAKLLDSTVQFYDSNENANIGMQDSSFK